MSTIYGLQSAQSHADLAAWELFLNRYPVRELFEFGTDSGAMSIWLAAQAYMRGGILFTTHDKEAAPGSSSFWAILKKFRAQFRAADFRTQNEILGKFIRIAQHPFVLFLNVDDAPDLVSLYSDALQPGDYLAVRNWDDRFTLKDMLPYFDSILEADTFRLGAEARFFRKQGFDELRRARRAMNLKKPGFIE